MLPKFLIGNKCKRKSHLNKQMYAACYGIYFLFKNCIHMFVEDKATLGNILRSVILLCDRSFCQPGNPQLGQTGWPVICRDFSVSTSATLGLFPQYWVRLTHAYKVSILPTEICSQPYLRSVPSPIYIFGGIIFSSRK